MKKQVIYQLPEEIRAVINRWAKEGNITKSQVVEQLVMRLASNHLWRDPTTCELTFVNQPYRQFVLGKING